MKYIYIYIYKVGAGSDGLCVMLKERLKESEETQKSFKVMFYSISK